MLRKMKDDSEKRDYFRQQRRRQRVLLNSDNTQICTNSVTILFNSGLTKFKQKKQRIVKFQKTKIQN